MLHLQYGCAGVQFTMKKITLWMNLDSSSYLLFCLEKVNSPTVEDLHSDNVSYPL